MVIWWIGTENGQTVTGNDWNEWFRNYHPELAGPAETPRKPESSQLWDTSYRERENEEEYNYLSDEAAKAESSGKSALKKIKSSFRFFRG